MTIWNAIILDLVQGFAEFLPISCSGHLSILNNLFDMTTAQGSHMFFGALLQLGTLISICIVYWQDIRQMFGETLGLMNIGRMAGMQKQRYPAARLLLMIVAATLPLLLILPIRSRLKILYNNNFYIGAALILTGCMLFISDKMKYGKKNEGSMSILDAVIIGICQCIASIPGLSRPGTAITGGLATGLSREFAVKFAFLLSLPAMLIGSILSLVSGIKAGIDWHSVPAYLIGMLAAMLAGIAAIYIMKHIARKGKFGSFAYYCWVMGVLAMILTMIF